MTGRLRQTKIIKCTKYGKLRLASVRILTGVTVVTVMYAVGITRFLLVMNSLIGWESLKSSVQITVSAVVFLPVTVGGLEVIIAAAGNITLLATVCFTLFLSGRMKSVFASVVTAFVFFLLPVVWLYDLRRKCEKLDLQHPPLQRDGADQQLYLCCDRYKICFHRKSGNLDAVPYDGGGSHRNHSFYLLSQWQDGAGKEGE